MQDRRNKTKYGKILSETLFYKVCLLYLICHVLLYNWLTRSVCVSAHLFGGTAAAAAAAAVAVGRGRSRSVAMAIAQSWWRSHVAG